MSMMVPVGCAGRAAAGAHRSRVAAASAVSINSVRDVALIQTLHPAHGAAAGCAGARAGPQSAPLESALAMARLSGAGAELRPYRHGAPSGRGPALHRDDGHGGRCSGVWGDAGPHHPEGAPNQRRRRGGDRGVDGRGHRGPRPRRCRQQKPQRRLTRSDRVTRRGAAPARTPPRPVAPHPPRPDSPYRTPAGSHGGKSGEQHRGVGGIDRGELLEGNAR